LVDVELADGTGGLPEEPVVNAGVVELVETGQYLNYFFINKVLKQIVHDLFLSALSF